MPGYYATYINIDTITIDTHIITTIKIKIGRSNATERFDNEKGGALSAQYFHAAIRSKLRPNA